MLRLMLMGTKRKKGDGRGLAFHGMDGGRKAGGRRVVRCRGRGISESTGKGDWEDRRA